MKGTTKNDLLHQALMQLREVGNSNLARLKILEDLFDEAYKAGSVLKDSQISVIMSRDQGLVGVTLSPEVAENLKNQQIENEESSGGRPSVYITETKLK